MARPEDTVTTPEAAAPAASPELEPEPNDPLISVLTRIIRVAVRVLAVLMTIVILFGVLDVVWVLYGRLKESPYGLLEISDLLATFGAFMAVLIAIEIFVNITVYLREDVVHVKIVMATALMAIARKVIILDFKETTALEGLAIAALVLGMSIGYWLIAYKVDKPSEMPRVPGVRKVPE